MAGWSEGHLQEEAGQGGAGMNSSAEEGLGWRSLLGRTYGLYRKRFWAFFRMAFLPGLLAYLFRQLAFFWIRPFLGPLLNRLLTPQLPTHVNFYDLFRAPPWYTYFVNAGNVISLLEGTMYWFLSAFLFVAVAAKVLAGEESSGPLSDSYTRARERVGVIFAVSLVVWTCFAVSGIIASFATVQIIERLHLGMLSGAALFFLPNILICGLLSRLGLTIPALIDDPGSSFFSAIRTSVRKTESWEPFFMLFVIKSAIAGYAVYWLANRGLDWLWQRGTLTATLDRWVSGIVYISMAAALETPLFIALSLLFRDSKLKRQGAVPAAVH